MQPYGPRLPAVLLHEGRWAICTAFCLETPAYLYGPTAANIKYLSIYSRIPFLIDAAAEFNIDDNVELYILTKPFQDGGDFRTKMILWARSHLGHKMPNGTVVPLDLNLLPKL